MTNMGNSREQSQTFSFLAVLSSLTGVELNCLLADSKLSCGIHSMPKASTGISSMQKSLAMRKPRTLLREVQLHDWSAFLHRILSLLRKLERRIKLQLVVARILYAQNFVCNGTNGVQTSSAVETQS